MGKMATWPQRPRSARRGPQPRPAGEPRSRERRGRGGLFPAGFRRGRLLTTPRFRTSGPQHCENIRSSRFKPPGVWRCVAAGNEDSVPLAGHWRGARGRGKLADTVAGGRTGTGRLRKKKEKEKNRKTSSFARPGTQPAGGSLPYGR